ncbi:AAA family ATPase [Brevibacillus dissolubilis]|uniref:AAA family ATPase n=1 Tax=Brevibacillus dissolubilis TaxID=1844116 RepID=UPI00159BD1FF|nr:AAA family ATPase [Brevibacillus dissolubilis]
MDKIHLYHLDASEEAHELVKRFVKDEATIRLVGSSKNLQEGITEIGRVYPDVILIDENIAPGQLYPHIQTLLVKFPFIGIIVTSTDQLVVKLKQFMNVGARDCLIKPFGASDLINSVNNVHRYVKQLKKQIIEQSARILVRSPKIISVISTKGGVGKSTISTLLTSGLASHYKERTAIVDLDLQFGDVSLLMDVNVKNTITNITESIEKLDAASLPPLLTKHHSGASIIPSPLNPEEADFITEYQLHRMFDLLREEFNYIIVDCPPGFTDQAIVALEQSDTILFVTTPELIALKNTKSGLKTMTELGIDPEKIKVVVNRFSSKHNFPLTVIEEVLGVPVYMTVSNDYVNIIDFFNQGHPQLVYESKSSLAKDMLRMIESVRTYHQIVKKKERRKWYWPFGRS